MDPAFWLALLAAVLGAASLVLHVIAPRTKTTIDDRLRDDVDEVLAFVRGQPKPVVVVEKATLTALLVLLVLGLAGSTQLSCAEVRPRAANGAVAGLQCEAPDVLAAMPDVVRFAIEAIRVWISGDGHIDPSGLAAAAKPIATDLGKCAFDAAVAVLASPAAGAKAGAPAAAATTIAGSELEATWRNIRGELGWAARAAP